jgi:hypothetical protein
MSTEIEKNEELSEQTIKVIEEINDRGGLEHFVDRMTGRDGGLRPSKPTAKDDDGLEQYLWRMCRFHGGQDTSLPVTASWWLQDVLDELDIDASVSGIMDDEGKEITSLLDEFTDVILVKVGRDPTAGAKRWNETGLLG